MCRTIVALGFLAVAAFTIVLTGCDADVANNSIAPPAGQPSVEADEHAGHEHDAADLETVKAELAKLSPEDAASAEEQHVCPVTGEMLGTMGPPKKVDVNGQQVWICCDSCRDKLLADPDKYLAKLNNERSAN